MGWTYDTSLGSDRDTVRLLVGDTISTDPQLSDEEMDAMLTVYVSTKATAIAVLRVLAAKYARFADKWVGDLKILASQKSRAYLEMANALSSSGSLTAAAPTAGGIFADEKQAQEDDEGLTVPSFKRGMMDNTE